MKVADLKEKEIEERGEAKSRGNQWWQQGLAEAAVLQAAIVREHLWRRVTSGVARASMYHM